MSFHPPLCYELDVADAEDDAFVANVVVWVVVVEDEVDLKSLYGGLDCNLELDLHWWLELYLHSFWKQSFVSTFLTKYHVLDTLQSSFDSTTHFTL